MGLRIDNPTAALADSGLVALTGWPDGPPIVPPLDLAVRLEALAAEIEDRSGALLRPVRLSWQAAVAGRAALLGLSRRGQTSPNGSCRLIPALDGWVALNLPRPDDLELVPALVGGTVTDPWQAVAAEAARLPAEEFVARGRLLGLAVAALGSTSTRAGTEAGPGPHPWTAVPRWPPSRPVAIGRRLRVVDLSSLWAGPIVGRILAEAGAQVTKVESSGRRDAARDNPPFYGWLHARDERTVVVNLRDPKGWQRAADLIDDADVVIEASRPWALEQLGLGPDDRPERAGRVWLSITGHGREPPGRDWVAFGDDAAVAGGLVGRDAVRRAGVLR